MVTYILLDNSLSMCRPANAPPQHQPGSSDALSSCYQSSQPPLTPSSDGSASSSSAAAAAATISSPPIAPGAAPPQEEQITFRHLAMHGIHLLLDHFEHHYKLEHVAVKAFSHEAVNISNFTRDYAAIRSELANLDVGSRTSFLTNFHSVVQDIISEWGTQVPVHVIVVTDGDPGFGSTSLRGFTAAFAQPLGFQGRVTVMCLNSIAREPQLHETRALFGRFFDLCGARGQIIFPAEASSSAGGDITHSVVEKMFAELIERRYKQFQGHLRLGSEQSCPVSLCPPPQPYEEIRDFSLVRSEVGDALDVTGFLSLSDVASPPVISRHLLLPRIDAVGAVGVGAGADGGGGVKEDDEMRAPNLCVFLHGALKVENLCALVEVGPSWYGILFSCADTKKKSNLMLALFSPGPRPVPWLGDLSQLGPLDEAPLEQMNQEPFPVKATHKPSYSSSPVVWIKHDSLRSDIQKVLRHARKMPDKTPHFYKELNRLKKAAITIGFVELLEGLASIFERECQVLPGTSHPDCAMQLSHAAAELRKREGLNVDYQIQPLGTVFKQK